MDDETKLEKAANDRLDSNRLEGFKEKDFRDIIELAPDCEVR